MCLGFELNRFISYSISASTDPAAAAAIELAVPELKEDDRPRGELFNVAEGEEGRRRREAREGELRGDAFGEFFGEPLTVRR